MDVFELRQRTIDDYADYARSFVTIADPRIDRFVADELGRGALWPDPLVQVSPTYAPGDSIASLVAAGVLEPRCAEVFVARRADGGIVAPLALRKHQVDALHAARDGRSYVLTSGTGSGKSLAYILPIVDHVLRMRAAGDARKRIQAADAIRPGSGQALRGSHRRLPHEPGIARVVAPDAA